MIEEVGLLLGMIMALLVDIVLFEVIVMFSKTIYDDFKLSKEVESLKQKSENH